MGALASAGPCSTLAERLETFASGPLDWQAICDAVLLAEVVAHRCGDLAFILVVTRRQPANVRVRGRLVMLDTRAAIDTDPAIPVRDEHAHARVRGEIAVLDASQRAVDDDVVAVKQVPHHDEMRRPVRILRADDSEALLFQESALCRGKLRARH